MVAKFLLKPTVSMAPGDTVVMTSLVRDIKLKYGDDIQVDVVSSYPLLWENNPHLTKLGLNQPDVQTVPLTYVPEMHDSQRGVHHHYIAAWHKAFQRATGLPVPVYHPKGDLHPDERETPLVSGRYWVIVPGGKRDMTNKWWHTDRYQEVVDRLRPLGFRFIQEGATKPLCYHPPLNGVLNLVGRTNQRDLMANIRFAEGVICGVTHQMHLAAVFDKPCVVLAGGREEPWWEAYSNQFGAFGPECTPVKTPHVYLHTLGRLDCCKVRGCWRRRTVPLNDGHPHYDQTTCCNPVLTERHPVPRCLDMISVEDVISGVLSYYGPDRLPPPDPNAPEPKLLREPAPITYATALPPLAAAKASS